MSAPAPDRLVAGRYALKASLGRGGMGVVWRAQDAVLGREVAVKEVVFPPTMAEEERRPAQARVLREARAAARLNHPGAVTLYDVVQDQGGTFIVMELVNAPTLADLVGEGGPLAVERVAGGRERHRYAGFVGVAGCQTDTPASGTRAAGVSRLCPARHTRSSGRTTGGRQALWPPAEVKPPLGEVAPDVPFLHDRVAADHAGAAPVGREAAPEQQRQDHAPSTTQKDSLDGGSR